MLNEYKESGMSHLIDDFFLYDLLNQLNVFLMLTCQRLGVSLKDSKFVLPTTCLTMYGLEVERWKPDYLETNFIS